MASHINPIIARRPSRLDAVLRIARFLGLVGFLGGLAALAALWAFGPQPADEAQWRMLIHAMRSIFYPCVFAAIVVLIITGTVMWRRRRQELKGQRWFQVMMIMIFVAVPVLHLSARFTMLRLVAAVDASDLDAAAALWNRLGWLYLAAFIIFSAVCGLGIVRPRWDHTGPSEPASTR